MTQVDIAEMAYWDLEQQLNYCVIMRPDLEYRDLDREVEKAFQAWQKEKEREDADGWIPDWDMADVN